MEEIDDEIKYELKISTILMEEEPKYKQIIEILSKLEEMKMEKSDICK